MAQQGFYDNNEGRNFPFQVPIGSMTRESDSASILLPTEIIADFGAILGIDALDTASDSSVWLSRICRVGSQFFFEFKCDAPGAYNRVLLFTRDLTDAEFLVEEVVDTPATEECGAAVSSAVSATSESSEDPCTDDFVWEGYLVTGLLDGLAEILSDGDSLTANSAALVIEPALIQNLLHSYARTLNLASDSRTKAEAPDDCDALAFDADATYVQARCLTGPVRFIPGYNSVILQDDQEVSLTFSAEVGAGLGEACDEVQRYASEAAPAGRTTLDGGLTCGEVIRSLAGVGGPRLEMVAARGATITEYPEEHRVVIDVNMSRLTVCFVDSSENLSSIESL